MVYQGVKISWRSYELLTNLEELLVNIFEKTIDMLRSFSQVGYLVGRVEDAKVCLAKSRAEWSTKVSHGWIPLTPAP